MADTTKTTVNIEQGSVDGYSGRTESVSQENNHHEVALTKLNEKPVQQVNEDGNGHAEYHHGTGFYMTILGCAFGLAASQIYFLLYGVLATTVANDLGQEYFLWIGTAGLVAQGVIAPFVGPVADMLGRRAILLGGIGAMILGSIICSAANTAAGYIAGQIFLGAGSVIAELLAIAIVAEIVPTAKRPLYGALVLATILPWSPGPLYAYLIARVNWRWVGLAMGLWNAIDFVILAVWYRPPPRVNAQGLSKKEQLRRIDVVGGVLITTSLIFVLVGLNWGGQSYPWKSGHVIGFLTTGFGLMLVFVLWEFFGVTYPLFPARIVRAPRPFFGILVVVFGAGINFIPLVALWPIEAISVYQADLLHVGAYTAPLGVCAVGGGMLSAALLYLLPKRDNWVMFLFCAMQTVGAACLVLADPYDMSTIWPALIFAVIGIGGVLVPNQILITAAAPDDLIASATALVVAIRACCQVIGLAIFYNQLINTLKGNLLKYAALPFISAGIVDLDEIYKIVFGLTSLPFSHFASTVPQLVANPVAAEKLKAGLIQAFIESFKHVWYITIAFGSLACIAAAAMGSVSNYMDQHVAVFL